MTSPTLPFHSAAKPDFDFWFHKMDIDIKKWHEFDILEIRGRIDGITCAGLRQSIEQAAVEGRRNLVLDFSGVSYMSSAGLRIILQSHKTLKLIGGELILASIPTAIMEVFTISGMGNFLHIVEELNSLSFIQIPAAPLLEINEIESDGIRFEWINSDRRPGKFSAIGSDEKLLRASYESVDVCVAKPADISYGLGLAALGDDYDDYKFLFGETVVIGHHFFSYPAVPKPVVDYSFFAGESQHNLNFLYGFGIHGAISRVLRFDMSNNSLSLEALLHAAGLVAETDVFGVVILGVSGGMDGMHLAKSPIIENQPETGEILDPENFSKWMSFTLESEEINKTIVACGIVVKPNGKPLPAMKGLLPESGRMHLHAAIFENGLWSNRLTDFGDELMRVVMDFEPQKVLHLLPGSKLKSGFIGIINLEAN
jgi:anti-anti-sigma factor